MPLGSKHIQHDLRWSIHSFICHTLRFLSRAFGAKDVERSKAVIFHGLFLSILVGLIFSVISVVFADSLLDLVGANDALKEKAMSLFQGCSRVDPICCPFHCTIFCFSSNWRYEDPIESGV